VTDAEEPSPSAAAALPAGRPIPPFQVAIVGRSPDGGWSALPPGAEGEVWVADGSPSGGCLAAGYLGDAAATAERFVELALPPASAARLLTAGGAPPPAAAARYFRTGDRGLVTPGGLLQLTGRLGLTLKIRGARVDLSQVEGALAACPLVAGAAAAAAAAPPPALAEQRRLVGYVVLREAGDGAGGGQEADPPRLLPLPPGAEAALRVWLAERLPPAAVPGALLRLDRLPLSPAGKLQRSRLPPPPPPPPPAPLPDAASPPPSSAGGSGEAAVMSALSSALGAPLEATDDFFARGGDSLGAAEAAGVLGVDARLIYAYPTARSLARALTSGGAADAAAGGDARPHKRLRGASPQPAAAALELPALEGDSDGEEAAPAAAAARQRLRELLASGAAAVVHRAANRCEPLARPPAAAALSSATPAPAAAPDAPAAAPPVACAWRRRLGRCVDADPLVLSFAACGGGGAYAYAYACSHDGDAVCVEAASGARLWRARGLGRADAGLAAAGGAIFVAANAPPAVHALCAATGAPLACWRGGEGDALRAPPAVDPWRRRAWVATHSRRLLALELVGGALRPAAAASLPAAAAARPAFHAARRLALLACLDGSVVAFHAGDGSSSSSGGGGGAAPAALREAWRASVGHPVFAAPAACESLAIVCSVAGGVAGLRWEDGAAAWTQRLEGEVFADVAAEPPGLPGRCLLATTASRLHCLSVGDGRRLWSLDLGIGPISAAPLGRPCGAAVWVCGSGGVLARVVVPAAGGGEPAVTRRIALPGQVFSSPVAVPGGGGLLLGCRDDRLYCLRGCD